ncbi:gamma-aminobutyraldehyde dehydrogenase [Hoyosella subflava]|uniref:Aldehyde dehydrogenase n=1 Tax=Hoyosella subflava (strain DSM 45089 / JCM 17490 / NBRC 109087 / DQS3-9A1) TaxID=443218 RepID=F6EI58_HOYSD|nr:gamma-aminobutyraldehyde dehydrogenase [Hoyosella subflava]AEF41165.1 Aldehyde dehydrogenase [Hoyosella subflava DQS3-9A1]
MNDFVKVTNFIHGEKTDSTDGRVLDIIDPSTGEKYGEAPNSGKADVDRAYASAAEAFVRWRLTTPGERQKALLGFADEVEAHTQELAEAESRNTGKVVAVTLSEELPAMVDQIRFFAGAARNLEGRSAGEYMAGHTSFIRREPIGVIGQVAPWNYPMMMAIWKLAPAIAAGNTVVLKPSDTTPVTAVMLAEFAAKHFGPGVLNIVCGDRTTGELVVKHPTAQMVSITGSVAAGKNVAAAASESLKRVHLELGGKAPVLVFPDADLDAAAEGIAVAGYFNAGQDCTAATRVIVHSSVHDQFVALLVKQAESIRTSYEKGRFDDDALVPPLNNVNQFNRVLEMIGTTPEHATIATGGKRQGDRGFYIEPTVITGLKQDDYLVQNEVFGPVITVQSFDDEAEVLANANGTEYALASSVWTKDISLALRLSRDLDFGCVWINTHIPLVAEMPHGGFKSSGYGKDLSGYGFEDYTRVKHVMAYIEG